MKTTAALLMVSMLLLAPIAQAFTIQNDPSDFEYEERVTIQTDIPQGNAYSVYAPTQVGDCRSLVTSGIMGANGLIAGVDLDRAGHYTITDDTVDDTQVFIADAKPLTISASRTPSNTPGGWNYQLQVVDEDNNAVSQAYVDVYHKGKAEFIRHYRADNTGLVHITHEALPYAGEYEVRAYKDLDDNNPNTIAVETTQYTHAFVHQSSPTCNPSTPYDAPELYGVGPTIQGNSIGVVRSEQPLNLEFVEGEMQVSNVPGITEFLVQSGTQPITPTRITLLEAGVVVHTITTPTVSNQAIPGLDLVYSAQTVDLDNNPIFKVILDGSWDTTSDITVRVIQDGDQDEVYEYEGEAIVLINDEIPIYVETNSGNQLSYTVPEPKQDGTPGAYEIGFRIWNKDGVEGKPPLVSNDDVTIAGDVLGASYAEYDAGLQEWRAWLTPKNSDADITLTIDWDNVGTVHFIIDTPADGGARSELVAPAEGLVVEGQESDVKLLVQKFNAGKKAFGACSTDNSDCYDNVPDAHVRLVWGDSGEPVHVSGSTTQNPRYAEFDPNIHDVSCSCFYDGEHYRFLNLVLDRTGTIVAISNTDAGSNSFQHYSYAEIPVAQAKQYTPQFSPSDALAGRFTNFELSWAGLDAATWQSDFSVDIQDASGKSVRDQGQFIVVDQQLLWSTSLPSGEYTLHVADKNNGLYQTDVPGVLTVVPAAVTFQYDQTDYNRLDSSLGDLTKALEETYVLGGGLGEIVQLRVNVDAPAGTPNTGRIRFDTTADDAAFALLAFSDSNDPLHVGGPELFPPGQPAAISEQGASYYVVEYDRDFTSDFEILYNGQPFLMLVWATGLGDITAEFLPSGNSLNSWQPASGVIHAIPPKVQVSSILSEHGYADTPLALTVATNNIVQFRVSDPTGLNLVDGLTVGLKRDVFGPSQMPGATVNQADTSNFGTAALGIIPDATGTMHAVATAGPAIIPTEFSLDTLPSSVIIYDRTNAEELFVEVPSKVTEGDNVLVRAATSKNAFPHGSVEAFNKTFTLIQGSVSIPSPSVVDDEVDYSIKVNISGFDPITRLITVENYVAPVAPTPQPPAPTPAPNGTEEPGNETAQPTPEPTPEPTPDPEPTTLELMRQARNEMNLNTVWREGQPINNLLDYPQIDTLPELKLAMRDVLGDDVMAVLSAAEYSSEQAELDAYLLVFALGVSGEYLNVFDAVFKEEQQTLEGLGEFLDGMLPMWEFIDYVAIELNGSEEAISANIQSKAETYLLAIYDDALEDFGACLDDATSDATAATCYTSFRQGVDEASVHEQALAQALNDEYAGFSQLTFLTPANDLTPVSSNSEPSFWATGDGITLLVLLVGGAIGGAGVFGFKFYQRKAADKAYDYGDEDDDDGTVEAYDGSDILDEDDLSDSSDDIIDEDDYDEDITEFRNPTQPPMEDLDDVLPDVDFDEDEDEKEAEGALNPFGLEDDAEDEEEEIDLGAGNEEATQEDAGEDEESFDAPEPFGDDSVQEANDAEWVEAQDEEPVTEAADDIAEDPFSDDDDLEDNLLKEFVDRR